MVNWRVCDSRVEVSEVLSWSRVNDVALVLEEDLVDLDEVFVDARVLEHNSNGDSL